MTTETKEARRVSIIFSGDSGDGMQLTGTQFTTASAVHGNNVSTLPDYPSEIRAPAGSVAGVSGFLLCFASEEAHTPGDRPDLLVAMNPAALKVYLPRLKPGGTLLVNGSVVAEATNELEESLCLRRPQRRGRLIEEQILRARSHGTGDLDKLSVGRRERLYQDVGAKRGTNPVKPLRCGHPRSTLRVDASICRLHAQQKVLGHADCWYEDGLLADPVDACVASTLRIEVVNRHAAHSE